MSRIWPKEEALREEFSCQYLADELPPQWDEIFLTQHLPRRAKMSALRLHRNVGTEQSQELAVLLREAANDPNHPIINLICEETSVEWTEVEDWPVLQRLLSLIAEKL